MRRVERMEFARVRMYECLSARSSAHARGSRLTDPSRMRLSREFAAKSIAANRFVELRNGSSIFDEPSVPSAL